MWAGGGPWRLVAALAMYGSWRPSGGPLIVRMLHAVVRGAMRVCVRDTARLCACGSLDECETVHEVVCLHARCGGRATSIIMRDASDPVA